MTLECTATNVGESPAEVCAQPYVSVAETGALYTSHFPACSEEIAPHEHARVQVQLDVQRELCSRHCDVHVFPVRGDGTPDPSGIVGLARALQVHAAAPGRDQPSIGECDALVDKWSHDDRFAPYWPFVHANPDEVRVFCLGQSRAVFACLDAASDSRRADACAPVTRPR